MRQRVSALVQQSDQLLVVLQRARSASGRHDGPLYRTLPGGGVEADESPIEAVAREVREEVGLTLTAARFVAMITDDNTATTLFSIDVAPGEPKLGIDPELACECPRLVGLARMPAPPEDAWRDPRAAELLKVVVTD